MKFLTLLILCLSFRLMAGVTVQKGAYALKSNVVVANQPSYYLTWVVAPAAYLIVEQTTNLVNTVWATNQILYPAWPTNIVMSATNPAVFYRVGRCFDDSLYPPIWTTNQP